MGRTLFDTHDLQIVAIPQGRGSDRTKVTITKWTVIKLFYYIFKLHRMSLTAKGVI